VILKKILRIWIQRRIPVGNERILLPFKWLVDERGVNNYGNRRMNNFEKIEKSGATQKQIIFFI
jgi:hypothetical protein